MLNRSPAAMRGFLLCTLGRLTYVCGMKMMVLTAVVLVYAGSASACSYANYFPVWIAQMAWGAWLLGAIVALLVWRRRAVRWIVWSFAFGIIIDVASYSIPRRGTGLWLFSPVCGTHLH